MAQQNTDPTAILLGFRDVPGWFSPPSLLGTALLWAERWTEARASQPHMQASVEEACKSGAWRTSGPFRFPSAHLL